MAFSFGSSPRSVVHPESALREIGSLSPHYDILLVSVHGGSEGMPALHVRNESEFFVGEPGNLIEFAHEARKLSEEDFPETSPLFRMSEIVPR